MRPNISPVGEQLAGPSPQSRLDPRLTPTYFEVSSVVGYDPLTGVLTRKRVGKFGARKYVGKPTGWRHSSGYIFTTIAGKKLKAHRVAWLLMTGGWPEDEIDHVNGDPSDNRWENLRPATRAQNCRNIRTPKHNTSGIKGVGFVPKRGVWRANIGVDGKLVFLGHFKTASDATEAYRIAAGKFHGEFARA